MMLEDKYRCSGGACPGRDGCQRFPLVGERLQPHEVMSALWARLPSNMPVCDQFIARPGAEDAMAPEWPC